MKKKITIAIDGFSSTGKSTIAKQLAKSLSYIYVDTGAMYRGVALFAKNNGLVTNGVVNEEKLISNLHLIHISFHFNDNLGYGELYLNDTNVESEIRNIEISNLVSKIATISEVREKLVAIQKEMGKNKGIVMDGRDIGTVVFPEAELKFFMTASADKRAQRRFEELVAKGEKVSYNDILKNITERDLMDTTRKDSPLVKAVDAIEIDNSEMTKEEQFNLISRLVEEKLNF